jgi:hypothetical protein
MTLSSREAAVGISSAFMKENPEVWEDEFRRR